MKPASLYFEPVAASSVYQTGFLQLLGTLKSALVDTEKLLNHAPEFERAHFLSQASSHADFELRMQRWDECEQRKLLLPPTL